MAALLVKTCNRDVMMRAAETVATAQERALLAEELQRFTTAQYRAPEMVRADQTTMTVALDLYIALHSALTHSRTPSVAPIRRGGSAGHCTCD